MDQDQLWLVKLEDKTTYLAYKNRLYNLIDKAIYDKGYCNNSENLVDILYHLQI